MMNKMEMIVKLSPANARNLYNLSNNIKSRQEVIRENSHNAFDEGADNCYVEISDAKEGLDVKMCHNGKGFESDEDLISFLTSVGVTYKDGRSTIGGKGVGSILNLACESINIHSYTDGNRISVKWDKPLADVSRIMNQDSMGEIYIKVEACNSGNQEMEVDNKTFITGVEINLQGVYYNDINDFQHDVLRQYIKYFTKVASFNEDGRIFNVHFKGWNSENFETLRKGCLKEEFQKLKKHRLKSEISYFNSEGEGFDEKHSKEFKEIRDLMKFSYKSYLENNLENTIREGEISFIVIHTKDPEVKELLNPLIKQKNNLGINQAEFFGVYPSKQGILIQERFNVKNIGGGGNGATQYLAIFECADIELNINRNALGGEEVNNKFEKRVRDIITMIDKIIKKKSNSTRKLDLNINGGASETSSEEPIQKYKAIIPPMEEGNDGTEEGETVEENISRVIAAIMGKKRIYSTNQEGQKVTIFEATCENEVLSKTELITYIDNTMLGFIIVYYNPSKGVDCYCLPINMEISEENLRKYGFWVELKYILKTGFNHDINDLKKIVCWEIHNSLRITGKSLKDKRHKEYKISRHDKTNRYELVDKENTNRIEIIEIKSIIEDMFGTPFR